MGDEERCDGSAVCDNCGGGLGVDAHAIAGELARLRGLVVRAREIARMVPKSTAPTEEDVAEAYSFLDDSEGIE